jgi:hypothetical protein
MNEEKYKAGHLRISFWIGFLFGLLFSFFAIIGIGAITAVTAL